MLAVRLGNGGYCDSLALVHACWRCCWAMMERYSCDRLALVHACWLAVLLGEIGYCDRLALVYVDCAAGR